MRGDVIVAWGCALGLSVNKTAGAIGVTLKSLKFRSGMVPDEEVQAARDKARLWRDNNRERDLENKRSWYAEWKSTPSAAEYLAETEEHRKAAHKQWQNDNREHVNEYAKQYYHTTYRDKGIADAKEWALKNKDRLVDYRNSRKEIERYLWVENQYNLSRQEYDKLVQQYPTCAICNCPSGKRKLHVDHDHSSGAVRGLLCNGCNTGIGYFEECLTTLASAATYLKTACTNFVWSDVRLPCGSPRKQRYRAVYEMLLEKQNARCGICYTVNPGGQWCKFAMDHNHTTGYIRGLLCTRCNIGIGNFKDDSNLATSAIAYLKKALVVAAEQEAR